MKTLVKVRSACCLANASTSHYDMHGFPSQSFIECVGVMKMFDSIEHEISEVMDLEKQNGFRYDFQEAQDAIIELMRHVIRGVQQDEAKSTSVQGIDDESTYQAVDWAQKILPQKYREGQSEYFGKKGMSLLVSSFTIKDPNRFGTGKRDKLDLSSHLDFEFHR